MDEPISGQPAGVGPGLPGGTDGAVPVLPSSVGTDGPSGSVAAHYLGWGWPVTVCGGRVVLALGAQVTAIVLPAVLADAVLAILDARHCPVPVLAEPRSPEYRVLLAGEPFGVPLPWPAGAHPAGETVVLPPSTTPHGPVTWQRPPTGHELRTCREIDIFAAVCTTVRTPTPSGRAAR